MRSLVIATGIFQRGMALPLGLYAKLPHASLCQACRRLRQYLLLAAFGLALGSGFKRQRKCVHVRLRRPQALFFADCYAPQLAPFDFGLYLALPARAACTTALPLYMRGPRGR